MMGHVSRGMMAVVGAMIGLVVWVDGAPAQIQNREMMGSRLTDVYGRPLVLQPQWEWESIQAEVARVVGGNLLIRSGGEDHLVKLTERTGILYTGEGEASYIRRQMIIAVTGTMADRKSINAEKITIFLGGRPEPGIQLAEDYMDPSELFASGGTAKRLQLPAGPNRGAAAGGAAQAGGRLAAERNGRRPAGRRRKLSEEAVGEDTRIVAVGRVTTVEPKLRFKPSNKVLVVNDPDSAKVTVLLGTAEARKVRITPRPGDDVHLIGYKTPNGMIHATEVVIRKDEIPDPNAKRNVRKHRPEKSEKKPAKKKTEDE